MKTTSIHLKTERLFIQPLTLQDNQFVFTLVNSPGWKKFVGDKNINTLQEASAYIQLMFDTPNLFWWNYGLQSTGELIGVITFIKRSYLEHFDIGFAQLSSFEKQGYAYEATKAALDEILRIEDHSMILGKVMPSNPSSIHLLEKLGLSFDYTFEEKGIPMSIYKRTVDS